jgi:hypothetical protein
MMPQYPTPQELSAADTLKFQKNVCAVIGALFGCLASFPLVTMIEEYANEKRKQRLNR